MTGSPTQANPATPQQNNENRRTLSTTFFIPLPDGTTVPVDLPRSILDSNPDLVDLSNTNEPRSQRITLTIGELCNVVRDAILTPRLTQEEVLLRVLMRHLQNEAQQLRATENGGNLRLTTPLINMGMMSPTRRAPGANGPQFSAVQDPLNEDGQQFRPRAPGSAQQ